MAWLLDTNAWISFLKPGQPSGKAIATRLAAVQANEIFFCSVVKAELWHGAEKYANRVARLAKLEEVFQRYVSFPFDDAAACTTPPSVTTWKRVLSSSGQMISRLRRSVWRMG